MAWTQTDKENWFKAQEIKRSYLKEAVRVIQTLKHNFDIHQYGALSINPELYPLYIMITKKYDPNKKTILVTGGVHGYETSGIHGALGFAKLDLSKYLSAFNIVIAPCISPWGYETINRWNNHAIDPNRSFKNDSPAEESRLFLDAMESHNVQPYAHFDLHETTDTDNTVFRPALAARDGIEQSLWEIPDGFYVVGDTENPQPKFQKAIIESVKKVTHIAPDDGNGKIIGKPIEQEGVINYPIKKLFLCAGFSNAEYTCTTEVYPDSPKVTDTICVEAQIAAIQGGLDYLLTLKT